MTFNSEWRKSFEKEHQEELAMVNYPDQRLSEFERDEREIEEMIQKTRERWKR